MQIKFAFFFNIYEFSKNFFKILEFCNEYNLFEIYHFLNLNYKLL